MVHENRQRRPEDRVCPKERACRWRVRPILVGDGPPSLRPPKTSVMQQRIHACRNDVRVLLEIKYRIEARSRFPVFLPTVEGIVKSGIYATRGYVGIVVTIKSLVKETCPSYLSRQPLLLASKLAPRPVLGPAENSRRPIDQVHFSDALRQKARRQVMHPRTQHIPFCTTRS